MAHNIPKIIWQTHNYLKKDLPEHYKQASQTWINLNPGWEHRYVDHIERLDTIKKYPKILNAYHGLDPRTQADIWRYIITYEHGGVYSDMDSVCIKPLDYILQNTEEYEIIVTPLNPPSFVFNGKYVTSNANYAVKKESKVMQEVISLFEKTEKGWESFIVSILSSDSVLYGFTAAKNNESFNTSFNDNFIIDNYGEEISYSEYINKIKDK